MAAVSVTDQSVQLRFLVDKEKKKVVNAEAGKDFVDVLFSFLTLPLGTIVRLLSKESNMQSVSIGSLSSLYQKVIDLDEQYLSIKIGRKEAVCILKAFLVTDNALVNCLNQFIGTVKDPVNKEITIKEEN